MPHRARVLIDTRYSGNDSPRMAGGSCVGGSPLGGSTTGGIVGGGSVSGGGTGRAGSSTMGSGVSAGMGMFIASPSVSLMGSMQTTRCRSSLRPVSGCHCVRLPCTLNDSVNDLAVWALMFYQTVRRRPDHSSRISASVSCLNFCRAQASEPMRSRWGMFSPALARIFHG